MQGSVPTGRCTCSLPDEEQEGGCLELSYCQAINRGRIAGEIIHGAVNGPRLSQTAALHMRVD